MRDPIAKPRNKKTGGAGIGLAIAKSIIQAYNEEIEVKVD